eukprot:gene28698-35600_t
MPKIVSPEVGMWNDIGDNLSNTLDLVAYSMANATIYTDETIGSVTSQKYLEHVAYVDKHTQSGWSRVAILPPGNCEGMWVGIGDYETQTFDLSLILSFKVWTVSNSDPPPGNYEEEDNVFVLRDLLQHSKNKADAEAYIQSVKRTWVNTTVYKDETIGGVHILTSTLSGVGISEKCWMVVITRSKNYEGEADVFVLRDLLQHSKNKAEAEAYIQSVKRTWGGF